MDNLIGEEAKLGKCQRAKGPWPAE